MSAEASLTAPHEDAAAVAERVLEERARALARRPDAPQDEALRAITFVVGGQGFAVEARRVREVLPYPPVTRLGGGAGALTGVVNVRGEVIPVTDICPLLGLERSGPTWAATILLQGPGPPLGLLADEVGDLVELAGAALVPPPPDAAATGLVAWVGEKALVLDVEALLVDERLGTTKDGRTNGVTRQIP